MKETFTAPDGKVACARSWDNAGLLTDFKFHYEHPDKLVNGICQKCAAEIREQQKAWIEGRTNEDPGIMSPDPFRQFQEHEHAAYDCNNGRYEGLRETRIVQTVDFDFAAVDGILDNVSPDARQQAGEALGAIFQWLYSQGSKTPLRTAAAKLAVLVSGVNPMTLEGRTLLSMGKELRRTKAAMSKASLVAQDKFGIKFKRSRSDEARANMARSQKGNRNKRNATLPANG